MVMEGNRFANMAHRLAYFFEAVSGSFRFKLKVKSLERVKEYLGWMLGGVWRKLAQFRAMWYFKFML